LAVSDLAEAGTGQYCAVLPQEPCTASNPWRKHIRSKPGTADGQAIVRRYSTGAVVRVGPTPPCLRDSRRDGTLNSPRPVPGVRSTAGLTSCRAALLGRFLPEKLAGVRVRLFSPGARIELAAGLPTLPATGGPALNCPSHAGPPIILHGMWPSRPAVHGGGKFFHGAQHQY
jgi:hypothetical protein